MWGNTPLKKSMAEETNEQFAADTADGRFAQLVRAVIEASPGDEFFVAFTLEDTKLAVGVHVLHDGRIFAEWRRSDGAFLTGKEYRLDGVTQDVMAEVVGDGVAAHFLQQPLSGL